MYCMKVQSNTIHELIRDIENEIEKLRTITSTLVSEFKTAATIIDENRDHRQQWVKQLQTLHQDISNITKDHPSLILDTISQENVKRMIASANDGF